MSFMAIYKKDVWPRNEEYGQLSVPYVSKSEHSHFSLAAIWAFQFIKSALTRLNLVQMLNRRNTRDEMCLYCCYSTTEYF